MKHVFIAVAVAASALCAPLAVYAASASVSAFQILPKDPRSVTVKAEGLDVDQVAAAKPKLTITAESPLRADSADGSTGSLEASIINTPTGTPPSITTGGFMPSTGDMAMYAAAAAAVAGAALIVVALLVKRGGGSHKE